MELHPRPRTWAEVDLSALRHNARVALERSPGAGLLAVVKADAYGHGAAACARALAAQTAMFGVANLAEAREVRQAAPEVPVLILGPAAPDERPHVVREGFRAVVSGVEEARAFVAHGPVTLHLAVDTGMGRMGVAEAEFSAAYGACARLPGVTVEAVATHLPCSDEDEAFTREQLGRFRGMVEAVREAKHHALNSAGILGFGPRGDALVRAGLMLYGIAPLGDGAALRPALAWKARVVLVRELPEGHGVSYGRTFVTPRPMRVATVAVGYADGYPRLVSGKAEVVISGVRRRVLGRVTMDLIMVDATGLDVAPGDEVVLIGEQGGTWVRCQEMAAWAETIPWEILTGIQRRVRRTYEGNVPDRFQ